MMFTVNGQEVPRNRIQVWTWLQHSFARIDVAHRHQFSAETPAEIQHLGAPILTGTLSSPQRSLHHTQYDIIPKFRRAMASDGETFDAGTYDDMEINAIADAILAGSAQLRVEPPAMTKLVRWSSRERPMDFAWESLMLTARGLLPGLNWRYSPRDDTVVVETNRSLWQEITPARNPLRIYGDLTVYPPVDVQAGDKLPGGLEVVSTYTDVTSGYERTEVRHP